MIDVFEQGLYRNDWHVNKTSDWSLSLIDSVGEDLVENKKDTYEKTVFALNRRLDTNLRTSAGIW